ncbi:MAG: PEP/pyruvate-binding domain-containing protein [Candidatus Omnitrophota bacterium]|nr:PEP/pyruvate-binding domain-containing protein [Candidatus Omnitrophota bacterium]
MRKSKLFYRKNREKAISIVIGLIFSFNIFFQGNSAFAADVKDASPGVFFNTVDSDKFAAFDIDTFSIPYNLGEVRYSNKGNSDKVVIHIQDAHCNYEAQHKISSIIDYLKTEYGISMINLEGGVGKYDLDIFNSITNENIRGEVANYFVKTGEINGAEFYAVTNPEKIILWGIDDKDIYMANLKIYRDSLRYKKQVDKYLKELTHILNNLKRHIYTPELLKIDMDYNAYKSGNMEFREYLGSLSAKAEEQGIEIRKFADLYLLNQAMEKEGEIDFKRANIERNMLIDELKLGLSKDELRELVEKSIDFKKKRISRKGFYNYLLGKAGELGFDTGRFPALLNYIVYIALYEAVDQFKVMEELEEFEAEIKEQLYRNDDQRRLNTLSRNLALLKNIFAIMLTKTDYRYYLANKSSFDAYNYLEFIRKEAPKCGIDARPDMNIVRLDSYREDIAKFYEYSFKRDEIFIKNMRFTPAAGGIKSAIIMTGGFHTENLCALFEEEGISYVSILPGFTMEEGYESPYFQLLEGGNTDGLQQTIRPVLAKTALLQIASKLAPVLAREIWGSERINALKAAAVFLRKLIEENEEDIEILGKIENTSVEEMEGSISVVFRLKDGTRQIITINRDSFESIFREKKEMMSAEDVSGINGPSYTFVGEDGFWRTVPGEIISKSLDEFSILPVVFYKGIDGDIRIVFGEKPGVYHDSLVPEGIDYFMKANLTGNSINVLMERGYDEKKHADILKIKEEIMAELRESGIISGNYVQVKDGEYFVVYTDPVTGRVFSSTELIDTDNVYHADIVSEINLQMANDIEALVEGRPASGIIKAINEILTKNHEIPIYTATVKKGVPAAMINPDYEKILARMRGNTGLIDYNSGDIYSLTLGKTLHGEKVIITQFSNARKFENFSMANPELYKVLKKTAQQRGISRVVSKVTSKVDGSLIDFPDIPMLEERIVSLGDEAKARGKFKASLGNKGAGIGEMISLGIRSPDGFIGTMNMYKAWVNNGKRLSIEAKQEIAREIYRLATGYGIDVLASGQTGHLWVSARSGAPVSMPGMLKTILDLKVRTLHDLGALYLQKLKLLKMAGSLDDLNPLYDLRMRAKEKLASAKGKAPKLKAGIEVLEELIYELEYSNLVNFLYARREAGHLRSLDDVVVLFKLRDDIIRSEDTEKIERFAKKLEALEDILDGLRLLDGKGALDNIEFLGRPLSLEEIAAHYRVKMDYMNNPDLAEELGEIFNPGPDSEAAISPDRILTEVTEDLWSNIFYAVRDVFRSCDKQVAAIGREYSDIPDNMGTAFIVQRMVYGDLDRDSLTGVMCSRNPKTGANRLYGEFLMSSKGERIVSGEGQPEDIDKLKIERPALYDELAKHAKTLEEHFGYPQDIEFTVESGQLYLLQTRDIKPSSIAQIRILQDMVKEGRINQDEAFKTALPYVEGLSISHIKKPEVPSDEDKPIVRGKGASPGAAVGHVVFSKEKIREYQKRGEKVIFVAKKAAVKMVDAQIMAEADGIITLEGGETSHLATIARAENKPTIVNVAGMQLVDGVLRCEMITPEGRKTVVLVKEGEVVSIDGTTGEIYLGEREIETGKVDLGDGVTDFQEIVDAVKKAFPERILEKEIRGVDFAKIDIREGVEKTEIPETGEVRSERRNPGGFLGGFLGDPEKTAKDFDYFRKAKGAVPSKNARKDPRIVRFVMSASKFVYDLSPESFHGDDDNGEGMCKELKIRGSALAFGFIFPYERRITLRVPGYSVIGDQKSKLKKAIPIFVKNIEENDFIGPLLDGFALTATSLEKNISYTLNYRELEPAGISAPMYSTGLIGKLLHKNGKVVTDIKVAREKDKIIIGSKSDDSVRVMVRVATDIASRGPEEFIESLNRFIESRKERYDLAAPGSLKGLEENLKEVKEIVPLEEHEDIKGCFADDGRVLYLNKSLMDRDNPLAFMGFIHEMGEAGYIDVPEGAFKDTGVPGIDGRSYKALITRHTYMRGVGKDFRRAVNALVEDGVDVNSLSPFQLLPLIEEKIREQSFKISETRQALLDKGESPVTLSEKGLVILNYIKRQQAADSTVEGFVPMDQEGIQGQLDPEANLEFTHQIRYLRGAIRRGCLNICLIPGYNAMTQAVQESFARKESRRFREFGVNTRVSHFRDLGDFKKWLEQAAVEVEKEKNRAKLPQVFVMCLKQEELDAVGDFKKRLMDEGREYAAGRFFINNDVRDTPEEAEAVKIHEVKVLEIAALLLNAKRLREDFGVLYTDPVLKNSTEDLLELLGVEISDKEDLETVMKKLAQGRIPFRITRVGWQEIEDYNDSMEEVLRSL